MRPEPTPEARADSCRHSHRLALVWARGARGKHRTTLASLSHDGYLAMAADARRNLVRWKAEAAK